MKRARLILIPVVLIVIGLLTLALYQSAEPRYHGQKLSAILFDANVVVLADEVPHYNDPRWQAATNAIHDLGTNAMPLLLRMLSSHDSKPKAALIQWLDRHPSLHCKIMSDVDRKNVAVLGLSLMGDHARAAWPWLIQWTSDASRERRIDGMDYLQFFHADKSIFLPILLREIKDPDLIVQKTAAYWFCYCYPKAAETAGVLKLFPELKDMQTIQSRNIDMQQILEF